MRSRSTSGDLDVSDVEVTVVVALLLASSGSVEPRHINAWATPVADSDGHTSLKISSDGWVV